MLQIQVQVPAEGAQEGNVDRLSIRQRVGIDRTRHEEHALLAEQSTVDIDLVVGEHQKEVGFAWRDHGAKNLRAEANVAGNRSAALAHAVYLGFLDVQSGKKCGIGKDVRCLDHALATEAGDDDVRDGVVYWHTTGPHENDLRNFHTRV